MVMARFWRVSIALLFVTTAVLTTRLVVAQQPDAWTRCVNSEKASPDAQISGCTTVIQSFQDTPQNRAVAFYNRGLGYHAKDNIDLAIADYTEAIRLNPQSAYPWNGRCIGRAIAGQFQQALADCNESLRRLPNHPNILDSRAFTYLKRGELDLAIADYNSVLKLNPKIASSLFGLGVAKQKKGDVAGGDADIAAAKVIKADIAAELARYGVAQMYFLSCGVAVMKGCEE